MSNHYGYLSNLEPDRGNLIKALQLVQNHEGYVSNEAIEEVAAYFGLPTAEVEGVLTFYAKFKRTRPGKYRLTVCDGTACHVKKSHGLLSAIYKKLNISQSHPTTPDFLFSVETVSCLGTCGMAPVMLINEEVHGLMTPDKLNRLIDSVIRQETEAAREVVK